MSMSSAYGVNGYVKRVGNMVGIRGSVYGPGKEDWNHNPFPIDEAKQIRDRLSEIITEIECPKLEVGALYQDADGDYLIKTKDGWESLDGDTYTDSYAARPVVKKFSPVSEVK